MHAFPRGKFTSEAQYRPIFVQGERATCVRFRCPSPNQDRSRRPEHIVSMPAAVLRPIPHPRSARDSPELRTDLPLIHVAHVVSAPIGHYRDISRFLKRSEQSPQSRLTPPSLGMQGLPGALAVLRGVIVLLAVTHLVQVIPTVEGCGLYACRQLSFLAWGCQADRTRTVFSSQADCDPSIAFFSLPTIE